MKKVLAMLALNKHSRGMIFGTFQLTAILYIFAFVVRRIAPHTPDYLHSMEYYHGAVETAPALLAIGILAGLFSDIMMRRAGVHDADAPSFKRKKGASDKDNQK